MLFACRDAFAGMQMRAIRVQEARVLADSAVDAGGVGPSASDVRGYARGRVGAHMRGLCAHIVGFGMVDTDGVHGNLKRCAGLVRQVLDLSQGEAEEGSLGDVPVETGVTAVLVLYQLARSHFPIADGSVLGAAISTAALEARKLGIRVFVRWGHLEHSVRLLTYSQLRPPVASRASR
jgi:hypothetical protein